MTTTQHYFCKDRITYTGRELKSRWIEECSDVAGNAIVAFIGPADVPIENMVDLEDVANNAPIKSDLMLHFIVEHFGISLERGVHRQRLLVAIIYEELMKRGVMRTLERRGDDLYDGDKKLSVSIAAPALESVCIHTALNITSDNTPVPTIGLSDYGIEPIPLAADVMKQYCEEIDGIAHACTKVKQIP